jgi:uracil-DNA glycosylase family 4
LQAQNISQDEFHRLVKLQLLRTKLFAGAAPVSDTEISQTHGQIFDQAINGRPVKILPMYHPAAALRAGAIMQLLRSDFQNIKAVLADLDKNGDSEQVSGKLHQPNLL